MARELFASTICTDVRLENLVKKIEVKKIETFEEEWSSIGGTVEASRTPSVSNPNGYWFRFQVNLFDVVRDISAVLPRLRIPRIALILSNYTTMTS